MHVPASFYEKEHSQETLETNRIPYLWEVGGRTEEEIVKDMGRLWVDLFG